MVRKWTHSSDPGRKVFSQKWWVGRPQLKSIYKHFKKWFEKQNMDSMSGIFQPHKNHKSKRHILAFNRYIGHIWHRFVLLEYHSQFQDTPNISILRPWIKMSSPQKKIHSGSFPNSCQLATFLWETDCNDYTNIFSLRKNTSLKSVDEYIILNPFTCTNHVVLPEKNKKLSNFRPQVRGKYAWPLWVDTPIRGMYSVAGGTFFSTKLVGGFNPSEKY